MSGPAGVPRVLHIHGSLASGNPLAERCVRVMEAFGGRLRHTLVSGNGEWNALDGLSRGVPVERRMAFPRLSGPPLPGRLQALARAMVDYHLVLTYGRGGILSALAHTSFAELLRLPPLIHHEDGSDEPARQRHGLRGTWYRRIGLGKASGLVVPTELMEAEALVRWQQPLGRVKTIPDGVDLDRLAKARKSDAIPRLLKRPGERWIGCAARFDGSEDFAPLLAGMAESDPALHLVVAGDGPARGVLTTRAGELGLDDRVHIVPPLPDGATLIVLSDIVAVLPASDPLPLEAIRAMGAGKPVVGFETGALGAALAVDNADFICQSGAYESFSLAVQQLAADEFLRRRIGEANREKAEAERDGKAMIATYRRLYSSAMRVDTI